MASSAYQRQKSSHEHARGGYHPRDLIRRYCNRISAISHQWAVIEVVRDLLWSADSMAWSFAGRWQGRNPNDRREAQAFVERVATQIAIG
jgi:hypothetical protein